jgi:hypothetical protein
MAQVIEKLIHQNSFNPKADILETLTLKQLRKTVPIPGLSALLTPGTHRDFMILFCVLWTLRLLINYNGFKRSQKVLLV